MKKIFILIIAIVLFSPFSRSHALTADQVLKLKKAGVSDATIQMMLKQELEGRSNAYDKLGTREVKDESGNTAIVYSTGSSTVDQDEKEKVENAWKMLQNMVNDRKLR